MSLSPPSLDGLAALMGEMRVQLSEHREEARESAEATRAQLSKIERDISTLAATAETTTKLDKIVNGDGSDVGLRVRQDRAEQKLAVIVWVVAAMGLLLIAKLFDWFSKLGGAS